MTMKNSFKHKETKATRTKDLRQKEVKVIILSLQKIKLKVPYREVILAEQIRDLHYEKKNFQGRNRVFSSGHLS